MPVIHDAILNHLPAWLLVMFRITGIFVIAPLFGSRTIPARIRVMMAAGLSLCIYPMLLSSDRPSAAMMSPLLEQGLSLWTLAPAVALELTIGAVIGYGASLPLIGMQLAGHINDQQLGIGLGGIINPELNDEGGIVSEFFFIAAMMVFVIVGGHRVILATLVGSFQSVPLGGMRPDGAMLDLGVGLVTSMYELAIRVSAPLLCLIFLETVALGFIARTVPQLNILNVGFPLRLMIGFALLALSVGSLVQVFGMELRQTMQRIAAYFGVG